MPRNDGKGADEDGERPDIPSHPKTRLLAGPRNDGHGADEDGERPDIPSCPKTRLLAGPRNDGKSANEDREFLVLFAEKSTGEIEFEN